ncbi:MAG: hypothetical protein LC540_19655 [Candidatus Thiodiazotropha sp.]|nr:hypothetical protein [Candidatus Thiodiazotropha sp.]
MVPGYRYCGPGNPLPNGPPVNALDAICMAHDFCYRNKISEMDCDRQMLISLWSHRGATLLEKLTKQFVIRPIIFSKWAAGMYLYEP